VRRSDPKGIRGLVSTSELIGRRVRLIACDVRLTSLQPGHTGTIEQVDSLGTVHVRWDSGASLGLVPGEDRWTLLPEAVVSGLSLGG